MPPAPVALFVYRRLEHTIATIRALQSNELATITRLYVFSDGARTEADRDAVAAVRSSLRDIGGFERVVVRERDENLGLARSIIAGVSEVVERHGSVIVLEDDMVTSRAFLAYMNDGLALYAEQPRVASIHGYMYPVDATLPETFFLKGTDCWGWATWSRAWRLFEPDPQVLLRQLQSRGLQHGFDLDGAYPYVGMLRDYAEGRNDSWAIRWHASAYVADMLTLFSRRSLVSNIGLDASGVHCAATTDYDVRLSDDPVVVAPVAVEECGDARDAIIRFYEAMKVPPPAPVEAPRRRGSLLRFLGRLLSQPAPRV